MRSNESLWMKSGDVTKWKGSSVIWTRRSNGTTFLCKMLETTQKLLSLEKWLIWRYVIFPLLYLPVLPDCWTLFRFWLQATFEKLENELREVNMNAETLKRNFLELTELKHILRMTQAFFDEVSHSSWGDLLRALLINFQSTAQRLRVKVLMSEKAVTKKSFPIK